MTTILSLIAATALGVQLFARSRHEPAAFHIVFLLCVVFFLFGLLNLIRDRIESWICGPEAGHEFSQVCESHPCESQNQNQLTQSQNQDPRR